MPGGNVRVLPLQNGVTSGRPPDCRIDQPSIEFAPNRNTSIIVFPLLSAGALSYRSDPREPSCGSVAALVLDAGASRARVVAASRRDRADRFARRVAVDVVPGAV